MTKTKERSWINTDDHQTKKHKTTTQGSGNPQPPEKIPPFRFRFPTDDAVRRYEDCISKRSLCMERGFTYSESNYFELMPIVTRLIKSHKWEKFCQCPSPASIPLVREFYANYDPKRPHLVYVRGKLVDASASAINSVYSLTDHQNTFLEAAFKFKDISSINCDILEELTGKRVARYRSFIPPMDLKEGPGIWINFINYNLFPTRKVKEVSKSAAILLYCIMVGEPINVGKVIAELIRKCASLKTADLWFPALITRLCERHNVLPASCEPVEQSWYISEGLVEQTVNDKPVESEPDQQTSHSDHLEKRAWRNTDHETKKHKITTQGSVLSTGNPHPPEKIPPFQFRFPTDKAVRQYEDRISKRSLCMERGFTYSESSYFKLMPIVTRLIESHKWEKFCQRPSPASIPLVREFYANYDPKMPHLVYVRGKLVDASASAINSVYSLSDHQNTFFEAASKAPDFSSDIVEEVIGKRFRMGTFKSSIDLKEDPGIWINFVNYNLFPTYENQVVCKNKAILLYCIMVGKPINVGKVIAKQIQKCASLKTTDLWFPALITRLCERHNVLPASCEPVERSRYILKRFVEQTVSDKPVESEPDQQTSHSDHHPPFLVNNTSHQSRDDIPKYSMDKLGCGANLPISAEATENAPSLFDSSRQSLLPTPQATSSQPLPPVAPSAPSVESSTLPQNDSDELSSPLPTTPATSSQQVPPVAPSAPPAEPSCPPQTDLDELPLGQALPIKVLSPQCGTICVQGYDVKRSVAPVLEAIFKKHGDIAAECLFKTASARSYFLEVVCEVVTRIETDDVIDKMEEVECQVSDAETANINVSWLRALLEAVHKGKEAMKKSDLLMETKVNTSLVKRAAQTDLRERCEELVAAQERFEKAERCARVLHIVENNLKNAILESKAENALLLKQRVL